MDIITFGNLLADFEIRLYNLEAGLRATIEAVNLERNAMLNSIDEAANKQIEDLNKYIELVQTLRGEKPSLEPGSIIELRQHNK